MKENIRISGFADEISPDFDRQLEVVTDLGMHYICLRAADGKGIAEYTVDEVKESLLPRLVKAGVGVSSIGSPIGKVEVDDEEGFAKQLEQFDTICKIAGILDCKYIRIFSFYIPKDKDPKDYRDIVIEKLKKILDIAKRYPVVLIHENEKGIYGDTGPRCRDIMDAINDPQFRTAFDFANFVQCGEDTKECWDLLKDTVVYIHIKDALYANKENVVCGTGEGRIKEILSEAIVDEGYEGFLTLEPHLFQFDTLASLEQEDTKGLVANKAKDGAEAYAMQYHALCDILNEI